MCVIFLLCCVICHIILFYLDYTIKHNKWCGNQTSGEYGSLLDARKSCNLDLNCTMFFDSESKNKKYVLCGSGGGIKFSTILRSRLYIKSYIKCKSVLNINHYP